MGSRVTEEIEMSARIGRKEVAKGSLVFGWAIFCLVCLGIFCPLAEAQKGPKTFASPEEAAKALVEAAKQEDAKALLDILGPEGKGLVSTGDQAADQAERKRFVSEYEEKSHLEQQADKRVILVVGKEERPFAIPIVKAGEAWQFDAKAGKEELLNRRIGRNELSAIQVCLAFVDAQREYAFRSQQKMGLLQYAQKFWSSEGKKDGLYWATKEGEEPSPFGPLAAKAAKEGYPQKKAGDKPAPYLGYFYKILKKQGPRASGGAYDYVVRGKMIGGFGLVARPAVYGITGVMTFMVNHDGVVFEKDLGKDTEKVVGAMNRFDPDKSWKKAE
jgi:Protein of unknown function (DUF2950)